VRRNSAIHTQKQQRRASAPGAASHIKDRTQSGKKLREGR